MCLLVLQKENTRLTEKELKSSDQANPDGIGYSFVKEEKLMVRKFRKFSKFLKGYDKDISRYGHQSPFLLHFRYATHGANIGTENVHPFKVRTDLVFGHNGIISDVTDDDKLSDTQMFNKEILKQLPIDFLVNTAQIKLISEFIGSSKLVFLDNKKQFSIINEDLGHWNDDKTIWFSNHGYTCVNKYVYGNYGTSAYSQNIWNASTQYRQITQGSKETKKRPYGWEEFDIEMKQCDWCGMESGDLVICDVTDWYSEESYDVVTADLCPECKKSNIKTKKGESDGFSLC